MSDILYMILSFIAGLLLGTLFFIIIAIYFVSQPSSEVHIEQKLIFGA